MNFQDLEHKLEQKVILSQKQTHTLDPAHDPLHLKRVARLAKTLRATEGGRLEVIIPAAWLHDLVVIPKNDPRRSQASRLSAEAALQFLTEISYPSEFFEEIAHAIEAHSFSAQIEPKTLEAKIVQDADRLDGLGAIGIARCFTVGGLLNRTIYSEQDPFCQNRTPNDLEFAIDHFFVKLFKIVPSLQTSTARQEGERRIQVMKDYLESLEKEIL